MRKPRKTTDSLGAAAAARPPAPAGSLVKLTPYRTQMAVQIVRTAVQVFRPDRALVMITDGSAAQQIVTHATHNATLQADEPLVRAVIQHGSRVLTAPSASELAAMGIPAERVPGSWMGAPLGPGSAAPLGAVSLSASAAQRFAAHDLELLELVLAPASLALQHLALLELLSEGKREWEQAIDAIRQAFCVVDAGGAVRRANVGFAELVQAPVTRLPGRMLTDVLAPEWLEPVHAALSSPGAAGIELNAGERTLLVTALRLGEGGFGASVIVFDDQTDKRRLQEQLVQSEKMSAIGQLIAGVAHDLNNPLASVVGFADYLVEGVAEVPPRLVEPLTAIREEAERAATIVKNLLTFARKQERQRRSQPIGPIVQSTLLLLRNQLMACRVEAAAEFEADLPDVNVDANQIQQVFVNLLNNACQAIQASRVGGRVTVRAQRWLDGVAITVEDDGPGIPDRLHEHVFEPFFTTKPEGEGTGLGLSICNGIVMEHGGRMALTNATRHGATFRIELPGGGPRDQLPPPTPSPVGPLRILVVDDEPHIRHYMQATLESWGHKVVVVADGQDAFRAATEQAFDVIISDLRMPQTGGREFYDALARSYPETARRVVFSTGDTVRGDTLAFLEGLGRPYLRKPFTLSELRSALAAATG